jgi:integrase
MPDLGDPEDRAIDYSRIDTILAAMPDVGRGLAGKSRDAFSKTKARLALIAYTGLPHALLKRLTPESVNWQEGKVTVPRRHKGKGVKTRTLPLTDRGLQALEHFAELGCWGSFSNSSMLKSWHRACDAAGVPRIRVYDLRHSFATKMYAQTGDPKATAAMLMHSEKSRMMDRYTVGGVDPRLQVATKAFNAAVPALKIVAVNRGSTGKTA